MTTTTPRWACSYHYATQTLVCRPVRSTQGPPSATAVAVDPPDAERNLRQASARAAKQVRLLVHQFELVHLWTLTYRSPTDLPSLYRDVSVFHRRLRAAHVAHRLVVPEQGGGRWHAHLVVGDVLAADLVHRCWSHGAIAPPAPQTTSRREAAAAVARYLTKEFSHPPARRRYIASRDLQPVEPMRFGAMDLEDAVQRITHLSGGPHRKHVTTRYTEVFEFGSSA